MTSIRARPVPFVASFIGSPPMNLLDGPTGGRRPRVRGEQRRPSALPAAVTALGGRELANRRAAGAPAARRRKSDADVETVEVLGAEHLIHGEVAGHDSSSAPARSTSRHRARTSPSALPPDSVHWFDPATGLRIKARSSWRLFPALELAVDLGALAVQRERVFLQLEAALGRRPAAGATRFRHRRTPRPGRR